MANQDIAPLVLEYEFRDGINILSESNSTLLNNAFNVTTSSNGDIISWHIVIQKSPVPTQVGDEVNFITTYFDSHVNDAGIFHYEATLCGSGICGLSAPLPDGGIGRINSTNVNNAGAWVIYEHNIEPVTVPALSEVSILT